MHVVLVDIENEEGRQDDDCARWEREERVRSNVHVTCHATTTRLCLEH